MRLVLLYIITVMLVVDMIHSKSFVVAAKKKKSKSPESDASMEEEDVIEFTSKADMKKKMEKVVDLKKKEVQGADLEISPQELRKLKRKEPELVKKVDIAKSLHGEKSRERATALSELGRNIYKQGRYEEVLSLSKEIVRIHEVIDGPEAEMTAKALQNVGSVAYHLQLMDECANSMNRALYIINQKYGRNSKEVIAACLQSLLVSDDPSMLTCLLYCNLGDALAGQDAQLPYPRRRGVGRTVS